MEAVNGAEVLEVTVRAGVNLVILDVNLPDIDGHEVARRLREREDTASIPILHLSATSVETNNVVAGLESGADAYLCEPAAL